MKIRHTLTARIAAFAAIVGALCLRAAAYEAASQADLQKFRAASGGDEVRKIANADGTYDIIHIFTNTAESANLAVPELNSIVPGSAQILVVGGGGAGSGNCGGGGGAGGLIFKDGLTIGYGTYAVTVGKGGVCATANETGTNGDDSVLNLGSQEYRAIGGGAGGRYGANNAQSGGSGGGAVYTGAVGAALQPSSASGGFGNAGGAGDSSRNYVGAGGGGAGGAGSAATSSKGGDGGAGREYAISGESKFYAAGGGGGRRLNEAVGTGGSGIGGSGVVGTDSTGTPGLDGTGSGGGGGSGGGNGKSYGGAGGSGVVIVRYTIKPADVLASVEGLSVAGSANEIYYSFTDTSTEQAFLLEKYAKVDILLVGGGGAGANAGNSGTSLGAAGGGGAGEMLEKNNVVLAAGEYLITVGKGGVNSGTTRGNGADGNPSKITIADSSTIVYQAFGGGGGGMSGAGRSGGSGGGGSCISSTSTAVGGVASGVGYVNAGGKGLHTQAGAGGGGAGSAGGNTTASNGAGVGGDGRASEITGESVVYAAGGAGGSRSNTAGVLGGSSGVGGNGGYGNRTLTDATSGLDGTGSGGGGSSRTGTGGSGGSGIVIIRIKEFMPEAPQDMTFEYDGSYHTVPTAPGYTIKDSQGKLVEAISARDVGIHNFTVSLDSKYDCWADGTTGAKTCVLTITKPRLRITSFSIEGWQIGQMPSSVVIDSVPALQDGEYVLKYSAGDDSWTEEVPAAAGNYLVKLEIKESNNFDPPDSIPDPVSFTLWDWDNWDNAPASLGYHAKFTVSGHSGEAVDAWVLVKFAEDSPLGFKYKYANPAGSDLRFTDESGNLLSFDITEWNVEGESTVMVQIPLCANGVAFYACWGELEGMELPQAPAGTAGDAAGREAAATPMMTQPGACFRNRWLTRPTISKTEWAEGDGEGVVVTPGEAVYGNAYWGFKPLAGALIASAIPTGAGQYTFMGCVDAGSEGEGGKSWGALYDALAAVTISGSSPYETLDGTSGNATLSGRVLLANDYDDGKFKVVDQAYYNTNVTDSVNGVYWVHNIVGECESVRGRGNLKGFNYNELLSTNSLSELCSSVRLWDLSDARMGNYFPADGTLSSADNYLPFSPYAMPGLSESGDVGDRMESVCILMRNNTDSAIYSPCYTNGIGTVYFDAVNSAVSETGNEFKIVVEICTNTVSAVTQIPTDENVLYTAPDENGDIVTDRYGRAVWHRVELLPLVRNGTPDFVAAEKTDELALAINNGGTCDNFYRVCAKVDYYGPVRFRIRRATKKENQKLDSNFILIDNIIASYPAMRADMEPCGKYSSNNGGSQVLGQAAAWSVPFPSVNDTNILARGQATYTTNPGNTAADTAEFFTGVKMHYRWRYLEQEIGEWQAVGLDHTGGFKADEPLKLPKGRVGDVEFFFESFLKAPYYEYVDYSGAGVGLSGLYTENISVVTNRANVYFNESMGTDWFVRLREGKSDYESIRLVAITEEEKYEGVFVTTNLVDMAVVGNGMWRGYLKTAAALPKGIKYRFEVMNRQEPGAAEWETNTAVWRASANAETLPASDILKVAAGDDDWATVPCDAVTGYLLFQIDDTTRGLTIVHADYQNFNAWNDAKGGIYVGTSTSDDSLDKTGASAKSKDYPETFDNWSDMRSDDPQHWSEKFVWALNYNAGVTDYVPFSSWDTINGWTAENGMVVYGKYRDSTVLFESQPDRALQMHGQGKGYIQFVDSAKSPRGLESIAFKARLAQFINFDDFAYYDAPVKTAMTNYSFVAASAFDLKKNTGFTGNASLSLIGYYRPGKGCYEFRVEQAKAKDKNGGYNAKGQVLSLYRWNYDSKGKIVATKLGEKYVDSYSPTDNWPECSSLTGKGYRPLFISLSTSPTGTCIVAGYKLSDAVTPSFSTSEVSGKQYNMVCYRDTSEQRLSGGTYGLLSANSEGYFANYAYFQQPVAQTAQIGPANRFDIFTNGSVTFGAAASEATSQIRNDLWYIRPARMATVEVSSVITALKNVVPEQQIDIFTANAGKTDWKLLKSVMCNTFGTPTPNDIKVYTTSDCSVKIALNGSTDDIRTDVVIDDVELKQFRGDDWANVGGECIPGLLDVADYRGLTNTIFTTSWIKNKGILLSGRRTVPEKPASIRSPLFDGYNGGAGLGMFSFNYEAAGSTTDYRTSLRKVNLLLQIATNGVNSSNIDNVHNFDSSMWTTVTNFDFRAKNSSGAYILPESGTCSHYLGLHGVKGVMRLVMDPAVVASVQSEMNPANFAEIRVKDVLWRDEPMLDSGSWWGWNLRTLGGDLDTEKRMLLADMYSLVRDGATGTNIVGRGLSLALNHSVTQGVANDDLKKELYRQHQPFVQTPTFVSNLVGEVSFKARKFDLGTAQPAQVTLYGSLTGSVEQNWELLETFVISNKTYETFSFKTDPSKAYAAFRLAVTGIDGITDPHVSNRKPEGGYEQPVRVLIDEVLVSEAVRARVAFRNVGAFRTHLDGTAYVPGVPSASEQPLCNESWGIQCEIFASQLADEIDFERTPSVRLHWYEGEYPWGYENWKSVKGAKSALLARATGTNFIYRSSYTTAQDAVVNPSFAPGTVVQYELEVVYYQKESNVPVTNYLSSAGSWVTPEWYAPVDKNAGKDAFTAYNILDTVAPKWAWINEVNLFGGFNSNYENADRDLQFVEIAVPAEADITGWSVRVLEAQIGNSMVITNTIGRFGSADLEPTKPNLIGMASNMVFRVLGNTLSRKNQKLKYADGTLDGVWNVDYKTADVSAEEISAIAPIGIQLVRGSGIVEHEIVALGTNYWSGVWESYTDMQPSNTVNALNRMMKGAAFEYVGEDDAGGTLSLSVLTNRGQISNDWSRAVTMTPGRINEGQEIDPDHPTPNGSSIIIYANLDNVFGHIYQTLGDVVATNRNQILVIQKGSERGTNITYTVDPWYELASVTTNGRAAVATKLDAPRTYQVNVGAGASNNVTVVAGAKVRSDLEKDYGLTVDNKYRDAILKWLEEGKTAKGPWKNYGLEEIFPVEFRSLYGTVVTNLTLTQIYWLDIDPTISNQAFVAGMASAPLPAIREGYYGSEAVTNVKMDVKMFVTNTADNAEAYFNGKTAYAPYTLRGLEPGSLSKDLAGNVAWTSVTFKVAGLLANGLTSEMNDRNWVPLRWFVFDDNSFDSDFITKIEVKDPLGTESPGYGAGWSDWVEEHGATPIFFKWAIDTKLKPFTVELLKKENYYGN